MSRHKAGPSRGALVKGLPGKPVPSGRRMSCALLREQRVGCRARSQHRPAFPLRTEGPAAPGRFSVSLGLTVSVCGGGILSTPGSHGPAPQGQPAAECPGGVRDPDQCLWDDCLPGPSSLLGAGHCGPGPHRLPACAASRKSASWPSLAQSAGWGRRRGPSAASVAPTSRPVVATLQPLPVLGPAPRPAPPLSAGPEDTRVGCWEGSKHPGHQRCPPVPGCVLRLGSCLPQEDHGLWGAGLLPA